MLINACEAYKVAREKAEEMDSEILEIISNKITEAAVNGEFNISYPAPLSNRVVKILESHGYKVKRLGNDFIIMYDSSVFS